MRPRQIAALCFTMAGLYGIVHCFGYFNLAMSFAPVLFTNNRGPSLLFALPLLAAFFTLALLLGFCVYLIHRRWQLAERLLVPGGASPPEAISVPDPSGEHEPGEVQALAFSVVGLVFMVNSAGGFYQTTSSIVALLKVSGTPLAERMASGTISSAVQWLVTTVAGLYLFFRGRGLARLWRRLQDTRGIRPPKDEEVGRNDGQ